jgi:WD40 repeat protein
MYIFTFWGVDVKKNIILAFILLSIILYALTISACQPAVELSNTPSVVVSKTATLSKTPAPTDTATPTPTQIPEFEVVATFGKGVIPQYLYSEDGNKIVVLQGHNISVLDGKTMEEITSLALPDEVFNGDDATLECLSPDGSLAIISSHTMWRNSFSIINLQTEDISIQEISDNANYADFIFTQDNETLIIRIIYQGTKTVEYSLVQWNRSKQRPDSWNVMEYPIQNSDAYMTYTKPVLSPDGSMVAAGYSDITGNDIYIWDAKIRKQLIIIEDQPAEINDVAFSRDGKWLASVGEDAILKLWDVNDGHLIKKVSGFTEELSDVEFSDDGYYISVYYKNHTRIARVSLSTWQIIEDRDVITIWDSFTEYELTQNYLMKGGDSFLQFSKDGSLLALAEGNIQIWDVATKTIKRVLTTENALSVSSMAFSDDGSKMAVRTIHDDVFVWDIESGKLVFSISGTTLELSQPAYKLGDNENEPGSRKLESIVFTCDGKFLIIPNGPIMELWDFANQEKLRIFEQTPVLSFIRKVSLSEDGNTVYALLDSYNRYAAWDIESGELLFEGQIKQYEDGEIWYAGISNSIIAAYEFTNFNSEHDLLHIVDISEESEGTEQISKEIIGSTIYGISLSSDGDFISVYSEVFTEINTSFYQIDIRKTSDFSLITSQQFDSLVEDISISDHGDLLATTYHGKVTIYNLSEFSRNINEFDYSPLSESNLPTTYPTYDYPTETPFPTLMIPTIQVATESELAISKKNAANLQETGRTGLGKVQSVLWQTDGDLQIVSTGGMFLLDGQTLDILEQNPVSDLNVTAGMISGGSPLIAGDIPLGDVQVQDSKTNEMVLQFDNGNQPAISPNGKWLIYVVEDKEIHTWNLQSNHEGPLLGVGDYIVSQPLFSPDSRYVAVPLDDCSIRIWDIEKGVVSTAVGGPVVPVTDFTFSSDGKYIVAAAGGSVWWWNLATNETNHLDLFEPVYWYNYAYDVMTFPDAVTSVSMNSSNSLLAIGTNQRKILFYDIKNGEFTDLNLQPNASAVKLGLNVNNTKLYSVDEDGQLVIWNLNDGSREVQNHLFSASFMGLAADSKHEVSIWGVNTLWQLDSNSLTLTEPIEFDVDQIFDVNPIKNIVAGYSALEMSLYDIETGDKVATLPNENDQVKISSEAKVERELVGGVFSSDGNRLVVFGEKGMWMYGNKDYELIDFYNADSGKKAILNPNGEIILFASGEHPVVMQLISFYPAKNLSPMPFAYGSFLFSEPIDTVDQFAFSPDNRNAAVYTYGGLSLYEISSGQKTVETNFDYQVMSVAYNPSGTLIAAGLEDGSVLLLDANTLETVTTLQAHTASVNHLVFTLDGEKLITAAEDGVVKIWGVE